MSGSLRPALLGLAQRGLVAWNAVAHARASWRRRRILHGSDARSDHRVVTSFSFSFPHPYIQFDVKDEAGTVQKWSAVMQLTRRACGRAAGRATR